MVNVYITLLLVIFPLALIVVIVTALTVSKRKKVNAQNYHKHKKDKAWIAGMKAYCKAYYIRYNKIMKIQARIAYKINRKNKLAALSKMVHALNPESIKAKCRTCYNNNKSPKQIKSKRYYKLKYLQNPQRARERSVITYSQNAEHIKQRAREHSAVIYSQNPEPFKQRAREHSAVRYSQNPEPQQKRAREYSSKSYKANPEPKRIKARECSQKITSKLLIQRRKWR